MSDHWAAYGRNYYSRHDYEDVDSAKANSLYNSLRAKLNVLPGQQFGPLTVTNADEFAYDDPVDRSHSAAQGLRISFAGGGRVVFRLSGTGTVGATLRVYLELVETDPAQLHKDAQAALAPIIAAAQAIAGIAAYTGRDAPDVIT